MHDYSRLNSIEWLQQVPRTLTPEVEQICKEIRTKPAFFVFWGGGPKGWVKDMENARLSFVYVLQANECLFDKEEAQFAPAVFLSSTDQRAADPTWLEAVASDLAPRLHTPEFAHAAALLDDPNSTIDLQLDPSATGGVPVKLWSEYVDPDMLPDGYVPESRVLPALLAGERWSLLPPKLYGS